MVTSTKLFILVFCYEILQLIRKHRISHKTHEWFYRYWGAQLLILSTLIFVTYFDTLKQKNKPALLFFYISLGLDGLILGIIIIMWLPICACINCCRKRNYTRLNSGDHDPEGQKSIPLVTLPNDIAINLPKKTQIHLPNTCFTLSWERKIRTGSDSTATINILRGMSINLSSDVIIMNAHDSTSPQREITLPQKSMINFPDNTKIKLPQGTNIDLPSNTTIKLITEVSLKIYDPNDRSRDTTLNEDLIANTEIILLGKTEVTLPSETTMTFSRSLGKVTVELKEFTLSKDTKIKLSTNCPLEKSVELSNEISLPKCTAIITIEEAVKNVRSVTDESVPPPLTLMCECCGCGTCWSIFTNVVSLILFLAFSSYLSQALPAITISYYLNPTASLIRLGFYEVIIVVMLLEISYLLFLLDKCTWLCYFSKYQEIPDEIKVKVVDGEDHAQETDERKSYICQYIHDGELIGCKEICGCDCTYKCIHWLHITTFLQIIIMVFIIGLSIALLYFLLNVVIQQTSSPNDQFKDILAIVPTIALNLWLLSRQVDIGKALKDITHKAHEYSHHNQPRDHSLA